MNFRTIQIIVISAVILSSLSLASIESGFAYEWTKSLAAAMHFDLAFRDTSDPSPTEDPVLSLDKDRYAPGETVVVKVTDTIPNVDLDGIDITIAKIDGSPLNLTETGIDSDMFTGSFTVGETFPVVEYSRSFSLGALVNTTSDTSTEDPFAHAARASADMDVSNPGDVKISDYYWFEDPDDAFNLCFKPVIHAANIQVENGASVGSADTSVTLSYANAFLDGESIANLQMWYQKDGMGPWQKISPTFNEDFILHPSDPSEWSLDSANKTITSDPVEAGYAGQVTTGKFTLGSDVGCLGGGGGGLVRPSLVVNALAGIGGGAGGGSAYSAPQIQLSNLVLLDWIDVPLEVEETVVNHDSSVPATPYDLGYFEDFEDYPLTIDDKGFVLSGFTTTLETQTLKTNTAHTIKFMVYESEIIQHFSLYTNLRGVNDEIHESDTQILYNANQELQVVDPNGFFENVTLSVNELEDTKKEVVLEITFAKEMDTSHIIARTWDPNLYSADVHILDAWKIVSDIEEEFPTPTYPEPEIQELRSQTIPIWIKSNAAWWSDEQISDEDFVSGLEYLITNGIIVVPGVEVGSSPTTVIPDWIKSNAGWWADSLISDDDFTEAMQWLVANGVIQI
jgi:hypothetical protein